MNYYSDFQDVNLMNVYIQMNTSLSIIGHLYDGIISENPSVDQRRSMHFNAQGYDYGEQIHDCYAGIGELLEQMEK